MTCNLCPRNCNVSRINDAGFCKTSSLTVSRVAPHYWEEPCISGSKGSGAIFFAGCNLRCRFCQNYVITVNPHGRQVTPVQLAKLMLYLQSLGVANVNLVTAAHFLPQVAEALSIAKPKLHVPVVYNSSGYEKASAIALLQGLVDVYLPDLKFCSSTLSKNFANAPDYFQVATDAIREMRRQQPADVFDADGYLQRGVVVRHLVLPGHVEDTKQVLDWLADFDKTLIVSLMAQYFVARTDDRYHELNRKLFRHEYDNAKQYFFNVGLTNGYCQDASSATVDYLPSFDDSQVDSALFSSELFTL